MSVSMYDIFVAAGVGAWTPDYATALSVVPQNVFTEKATKRDVILVGDDDSEERLEFGNSYPKFRVVLQWDVLTDTDHDLIWSYWVDPSKGRGMIRTFAWSHVSDGHVYIVRFDSDISRSWRRALLSVPTVTLRVLGYVS